MKKFILSAAIILASFVVLQSCQKEIIQKEIVKEVTIDTTLTAGSHYFLQLASFGDEGDVAHIIEAPSFASKSAIEEETDMFTSVYHYSAAATAAGNTDHVTISVSRKHCTDSTVIYLNLSIK
jgi:hypothetical protein